MKHSLVQKRVSQHFDSALARVGNTPLVRLRRVARDLSPHVELYAKLEHMNPSGSVEDRAAAQILVDALADGRLTPGKTLIDASSGNMGVSYAMLGSALGYEVVVVMPAPGSDRAYHDNHRRLIEAYGARVLETDAAAGFAGAVEHVRKLVAEDEERYFHADQLDNPSNPRAHYDTTAPEIWEATGGRVSHIVAALGSSSTLMGTSRRLKVFNSEVIAVAVQPADNEAVGAGFRNLDEGVPPAIYRADEVDVHIRVDAEQCQAMVDRLATEEGIFAGRTSGAALAASLEVAAALSQGVVVAMFPDHLDRYTC